MSVFLLPQSCQQLRRQLSLQQSAVQGVLRLGSRKTDIPVDAIRAVTRKDVRHTFIPWRKAGNHPCQQLLEVCLHTQIFRFMFLKPLPVVVCRQYFQEIQYARYIHILYF
jgi:hypothetical protein